MRDATSEAQSEHLLQASQGGTRCRSVALAAEESNRNVRTTFSQISSVSAWATSSVIYRNFLSDSWLNSLYFYYYGLRLLFVTETF